MELARRVRRSFGRIAEMGIASLVFGAGAAQLIPLLTMPLLARIYPPAAFGAFAVFGSVAGIIGIAATGRLHLAIPLASDDGEADGLYSLGQRVCSGVAVGIAFPVGVVVAFAVDSELHWAAWVVGLPLAVWTVGSTEVLVYWSLRKRREDLIARAGFSRAALSQTGQMTLGLLQPAAASMVGGMILGQFVSNQVLRASTTPSAVPKSARRLALRRHSSFPRVEMLSHASSSVVAFAFPLGIGAIYGSHVLGLYALAARVLAVPATVVGTAIGQYFLRELPGRVGAERRRLAIAISVTMIIGAAPLGLGLAMAGADAFALVFGNSWSDAGLLALAMWPIVWIRLGSSPLSGVFAVAARQHELFWFQLAVLVTAAGALFLGSQADLAPVWTTAAHTVPSAGIYIAMILRAWRLAR